MIQKCYYPGCKKEGALIFPFRLTNKKDASVELTFCMYHFHIVMGGHFKAKVHKGKKENIFELIGPLKEVEIAEQVFASIEMTAKLNEKNQCPICKKEIIAKKDNHHIDGNKNNNQEDNLILICARCHGFIHHPENMEGEVKKAEIRLLLKEYTNIWFKNKKSKKV